MFTHKENAMRMTATVALVAALWIVIPERTALAQEKVAAKWEYAELSFRGLPARPAGKDKDGNEVAGGTGSLTLQWTTGGDDVTVKGWDELAKKLKVEVKKDSSSVSQKIQVLNALGASGWELVDLQAPTPTAPVGGFGGGGGGAGGGGGFGGGGPRLNTTMLFKRRLP